MRRCPMCRTYNKPTTVKISYEIGAPHLDTEWLRPAIHSLVEHEVLNVGHVRILKTGELLQSNGEFIQFLW